VSRFISPDDIEKGVELCFMLSRSHYAGHYRKLYRDTVSLLYLAITFMRTRQVTAAYETRYACDDDGGGFVSSGRSVKYEKRLALPDSRIKVIFDKIEPVLRRGYRLPMMIAKRKRQHSSHCVPSCRKLCDRYASHTFYSSKFPVFSKIKFSLDRTMQRSEIDWNAAVTARKRSLKDLPFFQGPSGNI